MMFHACHARNRVAAGRLSRAALLSLVTLLSLALPARPASADPVSDFEGMRVVQKRNIEQSVANMPPLPGGETRTLGEILRISMEGGNLVARTPLPSTLVPGYARAKVPEFGQPIMVRVVGGTDPDKAARPGPQLPLGPHASPEAIVPAELLVQAADYSKPRQITSLSLSQSGNVVLSLSRVETSPTGSRSVQFLVQKIPSLPGGGGVSLIVNESNYQAGARPANTTFAAPDCATFLRRHPREVAKYLRPLLTELGQEAVFAPDRLLAQQVFPESFAADAGARLRVESLLPDLDAGDYHRRDRALSALQEMGKDAAKVMVYIDRSHFTPEQNTRVDRALAPLGLIPRTEAERLRRDPEFLLNCLYAEDPTTRRSALAEIKSITGQTADLPADASPDARAAAVRELRCKLAPATRP